MTLRVAYITLSAFVEQVLGHVDEETFISADGTVEIIHWQDGVDHFYYIYSAGGREPGQYLMGNAVDYVVTAVMAQELFNLSPDQVQGYID